MHENTVDPLLKGCEDGEIVIIEYLDSEEHSICDAAGIHVHGGVQTIDPGKPSVVIPYSVILTWRLYKDERECVKQE